MRLIPRNSMYVALYSIVSIVLLTGLYEINSPYIFWTANKKLEWSDFKGKPKLSNGLAAETYSGIKVVPLKQEMFADDIVEVNVVAYFNPQKSWVGVGQKNDATLAHEQLHFDITELFARKLHKLINASKFTLTDYNKLAESLHNKNFKECQATQEQYDEETNHGLHKENQAKWELKVDAWLKESDQ